MKTSYKIIFIACINAIAISQVMSQPTLTAANSNPVAGDFIFFHQASPTSSLPLTNAGASQTWNASSDTGTTTYFANVVNASSTPYSALFPGTNISFTGNNYEYYVANATEFSFAGAYYPTGPPDIFTDNWKLMIYPFTYTNTFSDNYSASNGITYTTGNITSTADGYGTLILPYGSITNCLRVHSIVNYIDSSSSLIDTVMMDWYSWYKPGIHLPVGEYYIYYIASTTLYLWRYLDQSLTNIKNLMPEKSNSLIYPNPFSSKISIQVNKQNFKDISFRIYDLFGQTVYPEKEYNSNVLQSEDIDLGFLSKGIYLVEVIIDGERTVKKIVKE